MPRRPREDFVYEPGEEVPRDVTRVVVPGSVTVLPADAFRGNRSLQEAVFEEGVVEIGGRAFFGCKSLRHLRFPSTLVKIGEEAFYGCTSLNDLNLPEGITQIGYGAFGRLSSLERIRLPSTLNVVAASAFNSCASLRDVIFPDGIRSIRGGAFYQCKSLESIVLPSTLNAIGSQAFFKCNSLRTVELRGGVQIILPHAFLGCDLLDHIKVPCKTVVITGNREGQDFVLEKDSFPPATRHKKLAISSECFNSIRPEEMSDMETAIMRIIGEEIRRSNGPWQEDFQYDEWDEKCQQLYALLAPHEKRHKKEIASLLEKRGVEMVQENVLSFLYFLC